MDFKDWEPIYLRILTDFGFDRAEDELSVRVLKAVTMNSDLRSGEEVADGMGRAVTVVGNAPCLERDMAETGFSGKILSSGSAVGRLISAGILPDMVFTDLDGDIGPQLEASSKGAVTFIHAHGDNQDLITRYAGLFKGPVVLTTQSVPELTVFNYGGFTDGDRAYCFARHFGADDIRLVGFDYDNPMPKEGTDSEIKKHKLAWAKRIIDKY